MSLKKYSILIALAVVCSTAFADFGDPAPEFFLRHREAIESYEEKSDFSNVFAEYEKMFLSLEEVRDEKQAPAEIDDDLHTFDFFLEKNPSFTEKGLSLYVTLVEKFKTNTSFYFYYARLLDRAKQSEKAIQILLQIQQIDPEDDQIAIELANVYYNTQNFSLAEQLLQKIFAEGRLYIVHYPRLATIYELQGNLEKSIQILELMVQKINSPNYAFSGNSYYSRVMKEPVLIQLANVYLNNKNYEKALQYYEQAAALGLENPEVYSILGTSYLDLPDPFRNLKKGIHYLELLNRKSPNVYRVMHRLGLALFEDGRAQESKELLLAATQLDPNHYGAYVSLGVIANSEGKFIDAVKHLEKAIPLLPKEIKASDAEATEFAAMAHATLGRASFLLGAFEIARVEFEASLKIEDSFEVSMLLVVAHWMLGNELAALQRIENDTAKRSTAFKLYEIHSMIWAQKGNAAKALQVLEKVDAVFYKKFSGDHEIKIAMNLVFGNYSAAINKLNQATSIFAKEGVDTHAILARIYYILKDYENSVQEMNISEKLQISPAALKPFHSLEFKVRRAILPSVIDANFKTESQVKALYDEIVKSENVLFRFDLTQFDTGILLNEFLQAVSSIKSANFTGFVRSLYEDATRRFPNSVALRAGRGVYLWEKYRNIHDWNAEIKSALALNAYDGPSNRMMTRVYLSQKNIDAALTAFGYAVRSTNPKDLLNKIAYDYQSSERQEIVRLLDRYIQNATSEEMIARAYLLKGLILFSDSVKLKSATAALKRAAVLSSSSTYATNVFLGFAYARLKEQAKVTEIYESLQVAEPVYAKQLKNFIDETAAGGQ